jgi:putative ABC transport system permease protein
VNSPDELGFFHSRRLINKLVLSNLAHRPVRTILSVLAIAVEVSMILTLVGVSYGTLDGTARRARGVGADIMVRPPGSSIRFWCKLCQCTRSGTE